MAAAHRYLASSMLFIACPLVAGANAVCANASKATSCSSAHTCCPDPYSNTKWGCCALANAVCCSRGGCCPEGSQCSGSTCTPETPVFPCGPVQGENCSMNYVCHPGPVKWMTSEKGSLLIMGDSVSIGYTPHLAKRVAEEVSSFGAVVHTPGAGDGGARSTSAAMQCMEYYLSSADGTPLPLTKQDTIAFNYGLHDYNLGLAGVKQYTQELTWVVQRLQQTPARLVFITTSPAHNVPASQAAGDDPNEVVIELNKAASTLMTQSGIPMIDVYQPIMDECGPVPFQDANSSTGKGNVVVAPAGGTCTGIIMDEAQCRTAAAAMGAEFGKVKEWPAKNRVNLGCWTFTGSNVFNFNTANKTSFVDGGNKNVQPVCETGQAACSLCAPHCSSLQVHYTAAGYEWISGVILDGLKDMSIITAVI